MGQKVKLVESEGPTSIYIDVEITAEGHLLFSGQDTGVAPQKCFGDSDYEYWLKVPATQKDALLLALIEKHYRGNDLVISEFQGLLRSKDIENEFSCY